MATNLQFQNKGSKKETCVIQPTVPCTVEVIREDKGYFTVYVNLEGMEPTTIFCDTVHKDLIFVVDVPQGVSVTMESVTHVTEAKILEQ